MTRLSEDGNSIEIDEGDVVVSAKLHGDVYGITSTLDEEDLEVTRATVEKSVEKLFDRIREETQ